jgi:hypothetical protein
MRLGLLILILTLAACGRVATTGTADIATFYGRSLVHEATREGAIALVVHGRPAPDLSQDEAARLIAERVRLPGWFPPTRLKRAAGDEQYRVVLIVNPVSIADAANHPCGPLDEMATEAEAGAIRVVGAFCSGDRVASANRGRAPSAEDLIPLVRQLVTSLFPPENPVLRGDEFWFRTGRWLFGG